jgi:putative transposase
MARPLRLAPGGVPQHVCNRGSRKGILFHSDDDYSAFLRIVAEARQVNPMRIVAMCAMPNHWHFLLWPKPDQDVPAFMHRMTTSHADYFRWKTESRGEGAVYQSRYTDIVIESSWHLAAAWRYVEMNPVKARLVTRPEEWPWSSAAREGPMTQILPMDEPPYPRPTGWIDMDQDGECV